MKSIPFQGGQKQTPFDDVRRVGLPRPGTLAFNGAGKIKGTKPQGNGQNSRRFTAHSSKGPSRVQAEHVATGLSVPSHLPLASLHNPE